jgi:hypothetical protein
MHAARSMNRGGDRAVAAASAVVTWVRNCGVGPSSGPRDVTVREAPMPSRDERRDDVVWMVQRQRPLATKASGQPAKELRPCVSLIRDQSECSPTRAAECSEKRSHSMHRSLGSEEANVIVHHWLLVRYRASSFWPSPTPPRPRSPAAPPTAASPPRTNPPAAHIHHTSPKPCRKYTPCPTSR